MKDLSVGFSPTQRAGAGLRPGLGVPLRLRLALIYGALASVALSLALVAGYGFYERAAFRNLDISLSLVLRMAQPSLDREGPLEPPRIGAKLAVREYDAQGKVLRSSAGPNELELDPVIALALGMPAHADWIGILPFVSYGPVNYVGLGLSVAAGERWRTLTTRLADRRIVQVLFPLGQIDASLASVRLKFWTLGLAGAMIVFALGYGLSGPSLRPLTRLSRAAEGVVHDPRGLLLASQGFDPDLSPLEDALKVAFERLSERERFVSGILGATPSLVYVYDFELDANTYSNDQLGPLLGYSHDQVRGFDGQFVDRLVHPDNRDLTLAHLGGVRDSQNGTVLENEYRVRHADGSWRWFRSRDIAFERGPNGRVKSILGVADDVTERRQTEANTQFLLNLDAASRLSQGPLEIEASVTRALGEHLGAVRCLILRVEDQVVKIEREWSAGVPSTLGQHALGGYFLPDAIAEHSAGRVIVIEDLQSHPGSQDRAEALLALGHASSIVAPLFGTGGWRGILAVYRDKPSFWRGDEVQLVRDVAARVWPELERARAVAELEVSRAQLNSALESSETATWEFDRVNDEIAYSGAYGPFHGLPSGAGRVAVADIRTLTLPEDDERNRPAFELALETGEMFEAEYRLRVAGLPERWVLSRGRVQGNPGGLVAGTLTDITERKRSEQLLRRGEARYRALALAGAQIVWRTDAHGEMFDPLERWSALTGVAPEHLNLETLLTDWVHPEDLGLGSARWHGAIRNGNPVEFEQRVRRASGDHRFWAVRAAPVRDDDGQILEWTGTDTDISERRRDENRLRELYETTQALSEAVTPEEVRRTVLERVVESAGANGGALRFVTDDGTALRLGEHLEGNRMNPDATLAFGLVPLGTEHPATEAARTGRPLFFSDASSLTERYPGLNDPISPRNATQSCAHLPLRGDGRILGVLTLNFVQPRPWDASERDFLLTLGDRASLALERSRLFETISRSEAQYRALAQSTTQFIWRRSSDGEDPESVTWWGNLTGQTPEQSSGLGWLEALHPEDREHARIAWTEAFTNGSFFATEYRVRSKTGSYVHLEVRGVPIPEADGTVIEWVGTFSDVSTERQAVERLREINAAQQRFVSDASHELRAPLTSIQGNLDVIMRYPNMSPEDRSESMSDALSEAKRMGRLVENLLAVARGEAGTAKHETVQLESVLASAWRVAQTLSATRTFELGSVEPALIEGDRDQIKQLALILLENAIKYTPDGGTVRLTAQVKDGQAEFCVADSGAGIAAKDVPHVFERFYRADQARTPGSDPGGTGLGLTIAKRIVENHGGSIRLESALGVGTTVWVCLRLAADEA